MSAAVSAVSLFSSSPALAQSIGSLTGSTSTSGAAPASPVQAAAAVVQQAAPAVEQATAPVAQTAAPVQQATAPATEAAAPVAQQAAPVVQQATAPVTEAAAPVVNQVAEPVAQVTAPVLKAAAPVVQSVTAPLASEALGPLSTVRGGTTKARPLDEIVAPLTAPLAEGRASGSGQAIADQSKTPASSTHLVPTRGERATVAGRGHEALGSALLSEAPVVTPSLPGSPHLSVAPNRGTSATAPRKPRFPGLPGSPAAPGSFAAPIPGGGAPIFVAALVAALLLAAPGLSRRLRLNTAPWPLPIALPSLERPG